VGACGGVSVVARSGVPPHPPLRQEPTLRTAVRHMHIQRKGAKTRPMKGEEGGERVTPACPLPCSLVVTMIMTLAWSDLFYLCVYVLCVLVVTVRCCASSTVARSTAGLV
jgi:hypothetical protein